MNHKLVVRLPLDPSGGTVELDGRALEGVTRISFDASARSGPTRISIDIYGEVIVDAEFQERSILAVRQADPVADLVRDITQELERAREKFPGRNLTIVALTEEVGELAKAAMDEPVEAVRKEAVQVAVMAMRVVLDGDHSVEYRRSQNGLEPLTPEPVHG